MSRAFEKNILSFFYICSFQSSRHPIIGFRYKSEAKLLKTVFDEYFFFLGVSLCWFFCSLMEINSKMCVITTVNTPKTDLLRDSQRAESFLSVIEFVYFKWAELRLPKGLGEGCFSGIIFSILYITFKSSLLSLFHRYTHIHSNKQSHGLEYQRH